jgi:hypothetical protein
MTPPYKYKKTPGQDFKSRKPLLETIDEVDVCSPVKMSQRYKSMRGKRPVHMINRVKSMPDLELNQRLASSGRKFSQKQFEFDDDQRDSPKSCHSSTKLHESIVADEVN